MGKEKYKYIQFSDKFIMDLTAHASQHQLAPQDPDIPSKPLHHLSAPKADQTPTPSLEPFLRDSAPSANSILGSPSKVRPTSVVATKNTRKQMEDRHVVLHDLKAYLPSALQGKIDSLENVSYYAVFDGHVGSDASAYAAEPDVTSIEMNGSEEFI